MCTEQIYYSFVMRDTVFSLDRVTASSSLPVGRRVSSGSCQALVSAMSQRSSTACWKYSRCLQIVHIVGTGILDVKTPPGSMITTGDSEGTHRSLDTQPWAGRWRWPLGRCSRLWMRC